MDIAVGRAMRAVTHELKVWPQYGDALQSGLKTFEFRRDDRTPGFEVGDVLRLREWRPTGRGDEHTEEWGYSGREWMRRVTYVARGGLIPDDAEGVAKAEPAPSQEDITGDIARGKP